jgi:hypothetical protein
MFERNRIDNADHGLLSVVITLDDGRELQGKLAIPAGRTLAEVLNGTSSFIEFAPFGGERVFLAKSALRSVKALDLPRAPSLDQARDLDGFEPLSVLGLSAQASFADVRQAYLRLAKIYHPDRYSMAALPQEVMGYLAAMAQRINAAYAALEAAHKARETRSRPIYSSVNSQPAC